MEEKVFNVIVASKLIVSYYWDNFNDMVAIMLC